MNRIINGIERAKVAIGATKCLTPEKTAEVSQKMAKN